MLSTKHAFLLFSAVGLSYLSFSKLNELKKRNEFSHVKKEIEEILWDRTCPDQHIGHLLVRLAWNSSCTFDNQSKTGGSEGATMRYAKEANDPANQGLEKARSRLERIKQLHPNISYSDLWVYASYVAIEKMGGPKIQFAYGRKDSPSEVFCPENGRIPDPNLDRKHIREVFYRMGLNDREIVALIGGCHTLGRCHVRRSGFDSNWNFNPLGFNNHFFKELLEKEWNLEYLKGNMMFVDKEKEKMLLPMDIEMKDDPEFRKMALEYKDNLVLLISDFANAYKKLTELGCKNLYRI